MGYITNFVHLGTCQSMHALIILTGLAVRAPMTLANRGGGGGGGGGCIACDTSLLYIISSKG